MRKQLGICLLFLLSGASGLIYQVVWVRSFGNIFGNTVYSASFVTAIFMLGLGVGSYLTGRWSDQKYSQDPNSMLRYYGYFEAGIGLWGFLIAVALPSLAPLSGVFSSYVRDANGWYVLSTGSYLFRYTTALVLLLPITILMGGTLTLLIRYFVRDNLSLTGWRVGMLYGLNTAGAAIGAFLVDFALIPNFGLLAAQSIAVVLNLGVGLIALRWASESQLDLPGSAEASNSTQDQDMEHLKDVGEVAENPVSPGTTEANPSALHTDKHTSQLSPAEANRVVYGTASAIFLSGFAAMGIEMLWFRFLSSTLMAHRSIFSLLLTVILIGTWLGSIVGGALERRVGRAAILFMLAQTFFMLSTLLFFALEPAFLTRFDLLFDYTSSSPTVQSLVSLWQRLRVILWVVGVPALLMGFAYPLANAHIQRTEASVGRRAGFLYLANTLGAVLGALSAGFLLLPNLGIQKSVLLLACCSGLTLVPLFLSQRIKGAPRYLASFATVCAVVTIVGLVLFTRLPEKSLLKRSFPFFGKDHGVKVLKLSEGVNETIAITENKADGARTLWTNGHPMSGNGTSSHRYMRSFVHIPMLQIKKPRRLLVICFGVGNTLHAASLYPSLKEIDIVDLSAQIVSHAGYFTEWNKNVLKDPRISVHINDGRQHLRMKPKGWYDVITLEPPPLQYAGVSALYSKEFYELAKSRLRKGGFITQWHPSYQVTAPISKSIVRAFIEVFPQSVLLSGYTQTLIIMGRKKKTIQIDPLKVLQRQKSLPRVRKDLKDINMNSLTEFIGTFAGSYRIMKKAVKDEPPVTDDFPIMEYDSTSYYQPRFIPRDFFYVQDVVRWCPKCFQNQKPIPEVKDLKGYLTFLGALYQTPNFLVTTDFGYVKDETPQIYRKLKHLRAIYEKSRYLRQVIRTGQPKPPVKRR